MNYSNKISNQIEIHVFFIKINFILNIDPEKPPIKNHPIIQRICSYAEA